MIEILQVYIIIGAVWGAYSLNARRRATKASRDGIFDTFLNNLLLWPFGLTLSATGGILREDMLEIYRYVQGEDYEIDQVTNDDLPGDDLGR
jgi:hypothetical protein